MNRKDHLRHYTNKEKSFSAFGSNWFGLKAEAFARFFGTPIFLIIQTVVVVIWGSLNILNITTFDPYPFILLNLAFSFQAAYAAPLILLAQTRQSDRDKIHADADAKHREEIATESRILVEQVQEQNKQILALLDQNTQLTKEIKDLSSQINSLTKEMHSHLTKHSGE